MLLDSSVLDVFGARMMYSGCVVPLTHSSVMMTASISEPGTSNITSSKIFSCNQNRSVLVHAQQSVKREQKNQNPTKIERNPRAPVCFSIADLAMPTNASSENLSVTLSMAKRALYCAINAFFGSDRIRTSISASRLWNGTNMGKRPTNSYQMHK